MEITDLEAGKWYRFTHTRKGSVLAVFVELDVDGDTIETAAPYITVDILTMVGMGQEHLANGGWVDPATGVKMGAPPFTRKKLRCELLTEITAADPPRDDILYPYP